MKYISIILLFLLSCSPEGSKPDYSSVEGYARTVLLAIQTQNYEILNSITEEDVRPLLVAKGFKKEEEIIKGIEMFKEKLPELNESLEDELFKALSMSKEIKFSWKDAKLNKVHTTSEKESIFEYATIDQKFWLICEINSNRINDKHFIFRIKGSSVKPF